MVFPAGTDVKFSSSATSWNLSKLAPNSLRNSENDTERARTSTPSQQTKRKQEGEEEEKVVSAEGERRAGRKRPRVGDGRSSQRGGRYRPLATVEAGALLDLGCGRWCWSAAARMDFNVHWA